MSSLLEDRLNFARKIAIEHAPLALKMRSSESPLSIERKVDFSRVTNADQRLNQLIVGDLEKAFPQDHIVAEESKNCANISSLASSASETICWYIDPIDGTEGYIKNTDAWAVHIGAAIAGKPVLGVVYQPQNGLLYYGQKGNGAYLENVFSKTKNQISLLEEESDSLDLRAVVSPNHRDSLAEKFFQKIKVKNFVRQGSIGLRIMKILNSEAELYVNLSGKTSNWDLCAPLEISAELGVKAYKLSLIHI